jgi:hypothetical protein
MVSRPSSPANYGFNYFFCIALDAIPHWLRSSPKMKIKLSERGLFRLFAWINKIKAFIAPEAPKKKNQKSFSGMLAVVIPPVLRLKPKNDEPRSKSTVQRIPRRPIFHLPSSIFQNPIFQSLAQLMRTNVCKFAVRAPVACSAKKRKRTPCPRRLIPGAIAVRSSSQSPLRSPPEIYALGPPRTRPHLPNQKSRASPAPTKNRKFQAAPLPSPSRRAFSRVLKGIQELIV